MAIEFDPHDHCRCLFTIIIYMSPIIKVINSKGHLGPVFGSLKEESLRL